jgi:3-oxoacyl-[acyl-carrier-protein] synthase I
VSHEVAIVGLGAVTPLGLYPEAIAAAVAGGISRYAVHEAMRDARDGSPLPLALLSRLPVTVPHTERMAWMGAIAARQAVQPIAAAADLRIAMLLSGPPPRPGFSREHLGALFRQLVLDLPVRFSARHSGLYESGHEGAVAALQHARDLLARDEVDACLVGGVESYCDPDVLDWLARANRLKGEEAPSGFVPGEGAGFALLATDSAARRLGITRRARLVGIGRAQEPSPWYMDRPTRGKGLSSAMTAALRSLPRDQLAAMVYSDANGEPWRADEWMFAYMRTGGRHADPLRVVHPADCWGDVGAATGLLLLAIAVVDIERGRARGSHVLLSCSSDSRPYRGVVLLEGRPPGGSPWA